MSGGKRKVNVVPYTFVRRGVSVREDTNPEPLACEVEWPVPFLAAFFSLSQGSSFKSNVSGREYDINCYFSCGRIYRNLLNRGERAV